MIAVINRSDRVLDAEVALLTEAARFQLAHHAAPAWRRSPVAVSFYGRGRTIPQNCWPVVIFDNPDVQGALGYHSETPEGLPYGRVFVDPVLDNGGTVLSGELSVAAVVSHEVLEAFFDPACDLEANTGEHRYAFESCDAVEADSYDVIVDDPHGNHVTVAVSNFLLPPWWDPQAAKGSKFDYLGKLTAPFTMTPGGYMIVDDQAVFGDDYPEGKRVLKQVAGSRTARRAAKAAASEPAQQ